MTVVTSAEFQKHFGHFKRVALNEPVKISMHGRETLVIISAAEYERLLALSQATGAPARNAKPAPAPARPRSAPSFPRAAREPEAQLTQNMADLERIASSTQSSIRFHDEREQDS